VGHNTGFPRNTNPQKKGLIMWDPKTKPKKKAWFWSSLIKLIICGPAASEETEAIFFP